MLVVNSVLCLRRPKMGTGLRSKKAKRLQQVWSLETLKRDLNKAKSNLEVAKAEKVQEKYLKTFEMEVEQLEREIHEYTTKRS